MNRFASTLLVLLLTLTAGGCDLVGDVLEFGFWLIVILIAIIVLLGWGIARMLRGRDRGPRDEHTP